MIVVDTNVIAYLFIPGARTPHAQKALLRDSQWAGPLLWRSEFRNVLAAYIRLGHMIYADALRFMEEAEFLMNGGEYDVPSSLVLSLAEQSGCSAYDCEFVALANELAIPLVTTDRQILDRFPSTTVPLEKFAA